MLRQVIMPKSMKLCYAKGFLNKHKYNLLYLKFNVNGIPQKNDGKQISRHFRTLSYFTLSVNLKNASLPSAVHLYTPASSNTSAKTLPISI